METNNNEILARICSKVATDLANRVQNQLPAVDNQLGSALKAISDTAPIVSNANISNLGGAIQNLIPETSKTYNILGYELGIYGIILLAVVVCCIIYMIYKYFCKCDQEVVNVKKNDVKPSTLDNKNLPKKKLNKDNETDSDSESDSDTE